MAQISTKSKLTAKQRKAAEMLANPDFTGTITQLCALCGVPRRTFYNWRDNPEFCQYVDELLEKYTDSELAGVWKALVRSCIEGNVKAMELFFKLKGRLNSQPAAVAENNLLDILREEPGDAVD